LQFVKANASAVTSGPQDDQGQTKTYSIRLVRNRIHQRLVRHLYAPLRMVKPILNQLLPHHQAHPQSHQWMAQLIPQCLPHPHQPRHRCQGVLSGASRDDIFVRLTTLPDASPSIAYDPLIDRVFRATSINIRRLYPLSWTWLAVPQSGDSPANTYAWL
jgi:hypothetical protein